MPAPSGARRNAFRTLNTLTTPAPEPGADSLDAFPLDSFVAILGPAGSGKTRALLARAERARAAGPTLCTSASRYAARRLGLPTLAEAAFDVLRRLRPETAFERISDVRAAHVFEEVAAPLFALDWNEFLDAEIDPEIAGLRAPVRFASSAYRLIRRLRAAHTSPDDFKRCAQSGATKFYGRPPNLADAQIIERTPAKYRDALRATPAALARQYAREIDLAKILERLYRTYLETMVAAGCLTDVDAVYEATALLAGSPVRTHFRHALVDDAQDLTAGEIAFLEALFGNGLEGVTVAGDPAQATREFNGSRSVLLERKPAVRLEGSGAVPPGIAQAAARVRGERVALLPSAAVVTYRGRDQADEAQFVAATAARLIAGGTSPEGIAVIARHLGCVRPYIDALVARGVDVALYGEASPFDFPATGDALAPLWITVDPFRHDYVLRNLEAPWLALSDATIGLLCADPPGEEPQPALFESPSDQPERRSGWGRERALRLGRNVLRGDCDERLDDDSRARLREFREALARWRRYDAEYPLPVALRAILDESALATLDPGPRGRFDRAMTAPLLAAAQRFAERDPAATLEPFLRYVERVAEADADLVSLQVRPDVPAVLVADVEAVKGMAFERVFVIDVRAGAFPRYYVPDAFLFAPGWGMIPKENVGDDAGAARTAKFAYLSAKLDLGRRYVAQERRALACAMTRARSTVYVSAWGRPTRGSNTPELEVELEASAS